MAGRRPGEFGGRPGQVQPQPHETTPYEQALLERAADPADEAATADTVLASRRLSGEYEATPE